MIKSVLLDDYKGSVFLIKVRLDMTPSGWSFRSELDSFPEENKDVKGLMFT